MLDVLTGNPIIQREIVTLIKSPKALAMQVGLAVTFVALVLIRWPSDARVDLSSAQAVQVFRVFGYGLLICLMLFVPAFPAVSLVKEKTKGTLALLFNSPMSPVSIYVGKFLGVFAFVCLLLFLSLPAVAACYAMGGINLIDHVGMLYLVLVVMVAQYTALGLLVSTRSSTPDAAMRTTYLVVAILAAVTLIPNLFFQGQSGQIATLTDWLRCLSPVPAVMEIMGQTSVSSAGRVEAGTLAIRFVVLALISIAGMAIATISQLNYRIFDRSRDQGRITDDQPTGVRVFRSMFFLVDPQRRKAGIRFINPVFVKEFRTRRFGRVHWILRLISFCAIISVALTFVATQQSQAWGPETIGGIMALLQILLILLLVPSTASGVISAERESGGWALLQMTPMSTVRIVWGKLLSAYVTAALILAGTLPGYLILIWIQPEMTYPVRQVLISLALAAVFTVSLTAFVSSLFKRTAPATATAYAISITMLIGTLLVWLGRDAPFGFEVVRTALLLNPVAAAMSELKVPGFEIYQIVPLAWWISGSLTLLLHIGLAIQVARISRPS